MAFLTPMFTAAQEVHAYSKALIADSRNYWHWSLGLKGLVAGLGVTLVLGGYSEARGPWLLAVIAIGGEFLQLRSDLLKGRGERLKRLSGYADTFGWTISDVEVKEAGKSLTNRQRAIAEVRMHEEPSFVSTEPPGPRRAAQSLRRKAYWSKDLANVDLIVSSVVVALVILATLGALVVSLDQASGVVEAAKAGHLPVGHTHHLEGVSKVLCAAIALLVSLGSLKLLYGYGAFARASDRALTAATAFDVPSPDQALVLLATLDYEIARLVSPLGSDTIYHLRKPVLQQYAPYGQPPPTSIQGRPRRVLSGLFALLSKPQKIDPLAGLEPLPFDLDRYFQRTERSFEAPLASLQPTRARQDGIKHAYQLMRGAYHGGHVKRLPLEVRVVPNTDPPKYDIIDGNSTYAVARHSGWPQILCMATVEGPTTP